MRYHKQRFQHNPPETYGDCHRTSLACLMNLELDDVPNFAEKHWDDWNAFDAAVTKWLSIRGLGQMHIVYNCTLEETLNSVECINPGLVFLLGGTSANGHNHTIVAGHGRILWDPSRNDAGIVKPMSDGYYWVTLLVPFFHFLHKDKT